MSNYSARRRQPPQGRKPRNGAATRLLDYFEQHPGAELTLDDMMRMCGIISRRAMSTHVWEANQIADGIRIEQKIIYSLRVGCD